MGLDPWLHATGASGGHAAGALFNSSKSQSKISIFGSGLTAIHVASIEESTVLALRTSPPVAIPETNQSF